MFLCALPGTQKYRDVTSILTTRVAEGQGFEPRYITQLCASPYKNHDSIHDLLWLSRPLPNQAPGLGTWSLVKKSLLTKSKTCIFGSKFFTITYVGNIGCFTKILGIKFSFHPQYILSLNSCLDHEQIR